MVSYPIYNTLDGVTLGEDWKNEQGMIVKEVVVAYLRQYYRIHMEVSHEKSIYSLRGKYRTRTSRIQKRTNQNNPQL
jgi:hypothetical protein